LKLSIPTTNSPPHPHHPTHTLTGRGSNLPDRSFISNSDDARNPPFEPYRDLLLDAECSVTVHNPHVLEYPGVGISHELSDVVKGADVVAILTGHNEYFSLDARVFKGLMGQERPVVVDGRNVVDADGFIGAGFVYKGIGRGDKNDHSIR
jgi:UDP-N-acetyl-D-mannosaminuronic acid dehydrogenase